ncbi:MAG: formylglycine-generating enzyme family protein [Elusimicrobia bacterium]|nr:formylglycine-generating enzyme family protein [Elusimicrobiota bacterium]
MAAWLFLLTWASAGFCQGASGQDRRNAARADGGGQRGAAAAGEAGIEWVTIPGGTFTMGADGWPDTKPRHAVTIKTFQMAKTEVTCDQFMACVSAGACRRPSDLVGGKDYPVTFVDWHQAQAFSEWVGGRLPSEAEWEYAARSAGKERKYPWGDEEPSLDRTISDSRGFSDSGKVETVAGAWTRERYRALPVCSNAGENTEQGLCDMAGNAWEWTQDWHHGSYEGAPADGRAWESPAGSLRVYRGGSWYFIGPGRFRAAHRNARLPGLADFYIGFRPVR